MLSNRNVPAQTQPVHSQRFRPGQTFYAYAMFAAPPEGVTTMDVQLLTGLQLAEGARATARFFAFMLSEAPARDEEAEAATLAALAAVI